MSSILLMTFDKNMILLMILNESKKLKNFLFKVRRMQNVSEKIFLIFFCDFRILRTLYIGYFVWQIFEVESN